MSAIHRGRGQRIVDTTLKAVYCDAGSDLRRELSSLVWYLRGSWRRVLLTRVVAMPFLAILDYANMNEMLAVDDKRGRCSGRKVNEHRCESRGKGQDLGVSKTV